MGSYDFAFDRTHDGRPLRMRTLADKYTRECLAIDPSDGSTRSTYWIARRSCSSRRAHPTSSGPITGSRPNEATRARSAALTHEDEGPHRAAGPCCVHARIVIELATTWAVRIKWDHSPEDFDPDEARENAIDFMVTALVARGRS